MQLPTDNLYKFLAIFGLLVAAFSVYVPLLRYVEFIRVSHRVDAIYGPMIESLRAIDDEARARLECAIYKAYLLEKKQPPTPDPCSDVVVVKDKTASARTELERQKAQVAPLEVERNSLWQEYVLFLYVGIGGLLTGVAMCIAGFGLWYVRLQKYLDAAVRAEASPKPSTVRVSRSRRGA